MAAIAEIPNVNDAIPVKKPRSRRALKQKNLSSSEANVLAATISQSPDLALPLEQSADKENHESLSLPKSQKKSKRGASKAKIQTEESTFEKELQEMQDKLQRLTIEKEQTEELLKAREETLKQKEEELEVRGKEQEKLQMEFKKLQKIKEFKPTLNFPILQSMGDREQEKKGKKVNNPATKRPATPYLLWCKDQWNEVKKANPDAEFKEITNQLGAKWKTITPEEKKPYEEKYQAEKEAYLKVVGNEKREREAMKLLEEEHKQKTAMELLEQFIQFQQDTMTENKKKKKEKDPLKPKQPLSVYFVFTNERRSALLAENKNVKEVAKITGEEWKNMTDKQRAPYEDIAAKNKEQYLQEMEVYKKMKEDEAANHKKEEDEMFELKKQEALQLLKKKEKTENLIKKTKENQRKKNKEEKDAADPNRPKKPASSYFLFSKEERKKIMEEKPGTNNATVKALISVKWKELSEEEKHMWNNKAAGAMEAYKKELEEYNNSAAENQKNIEK